MIRTLVVDDDFRVAELHGAYVERVPGFEVVGHAHSAAALFEALKRVRPDLILLDLYLPDLHGLEALRRIRASRASEVDVIALTAANDIASVRGAIQAGVISYLLKPFGFDTLEQKLLSYASLRSELLGARQADQARLDRLFGCTTKATQMSQQLHADHTLETLSRLLQDLGREVSASELAGEMGISRATAQRYLVQLEALGRVVMRRRYGETGRPEHLYRWVDQETPPRC